MQKKSTMKGRSKLNWYCNIKQGALILSFAIIVIACSNNDQEVKSEGQFSYDNKEFKLDEGFIEELGGSKWVRSSGRGFYIYSSSVAIYPLVDNQLLIYAKNGNALIFKLYTTNGDSIDNGTYVYDTLKTDRIGTFNRGSVYLNFNTEEETGNAYNIKSGTLKINGSNDWYDIEFSGTTSEDKEISGYYSGKLPVRENQTTNVQ